MTKLLVTINELPYIICIMNDTDVLLSKLTTDLDSVKSLTDLENVQINYLGRSGFVNQLLKKIGEIPAEQKKEYGAKINEIKHSIEVKLQQKKGEILESSEKTSYVDITLPGKKYPKGSLHPITYAVEEITAIFNKIGFIRMTYPEVEWEYYSFESLNMPKDHPARDDFETFFVKANEHNKFGKMVLTPHTSSGQNREMKRVLETLPAGRQAPMKMINIAKTYRPNWDATHTPMFHQFEGMCIDKGINITHLKGTLTYFAKEFFGEKREIRLRPHHFQFTEPSFEVDITCGICFGTGEINKQRCKVCKSGWLELGGSGMMHPNVLKEGGIDPDEYTGFAFGWGVERTFMMKEGLKLDDMRIMYSGDIRFLEQF